MGDGLTGDSEKTGDFTTTVVLNETHALFALEASGDVGWLAVGVGNTMVNSDIYVTWPDSGSQWVLSHRTCTESVFLLPGSSDLVQVEALSSDSTVAFTRPLDLKDAEIKSNSDLTFIYAACGTKPSSSETDAEIEEHDNGTYGTKSIDLSKSYGKSSSSVVASGGASNSDSEDPSDSSGTSPSTSSQNGSFASRTVSDSSTTLANPTSSDSSQDQDRDGSASSGSSDSAEVTSDGPDVDPKTIFLVHAVLAIIAWCFLSPAAIVFGRYRPHKEAAKAIKKPIFYWLDMHERLQYTTLTLTIVTVALGVYGINAKATSHFKKTHQLYGIIFLCLVICQVFLGWTVHALGRGGGDKRPWKRWLHILLGLTLTATGLWQCWTGWSLLMYAQLDWPNAVRMALGMLACLACAAYGAKFIQTLWKRSNFISTYNQRAQQYRLPQSQESVISRTWTDKLQKDIDDLQERVHSLSQKPSARGGGDGVMPNRSMRSVGSTDMKDSYKQGSLAPPSAMPWSVAHQPYYGSPLPPNMSMLRYE